MTTINPDNDPMVKLHSKRETSTSKKRSKSALWAFLGFLGFVLLLWLGVNLLSSIAHDPVASDKASTETITEDHIQTKSNDNTVTTPVDSNKTVIEEKKLPVIPAPAPAPVAPVIAPSTSTDANAVHTQTSDAKEPAKVITVKPAKSDTVVSTEKKDTIVVPAPNNVIPQSNSSQPSIVITPESKNDAVKPADDSKTNNTVTIED